MYALESGGDSIGDALYEELYGAVVHMLRTGQSEVRWGARKASCPVVGFTTRFLGKESSYAGAEGGPVVRVDYLTREGSKGWTTYIVPRRVLRGEFPDTLHELLATIFTAPEGYDN